MTNSKMNIGAKISLDGEKEYRQAIGNVGKSMAVLKSELKAVSSEYQGNANSLDALKSKNDILSKQQTEQEKKLKLLRGALEDATKEYGENSKKAQDWQIKLNNAYAELKKINRELDENEKYMKEAEKSTDKTAKSIDEFGKEVKDAKNETIGFGDVLKANLTSEAIVQGIKGMVNGLRDIITETEEYRQDLSKLETNTKLAGAAFDDVKDKLRDLDAITKETDSNVEALSNLLQTGFKGNDLADVVNALSGAVIKFPDTLKIESLSDALQETLATGKATGQFGELLERLGYNLEEFNKDLSTVTTQAERQQYALSVLASTGLSKVNDEYRKSNKELIEYSNAQFKMREVMSDIAVAATPLLSKAMSTLADNGEELANDVLPPIISGFTWMVENSDLIVSGLKGIGAAFITKKMADGITYATKAYKTLTTATEAATTAQTAFNTASKANAIGAIVSVVIGLGTALYSYAKSSSDASEETRKLTDETEQLLESSRKLNEEIRQGIENRKESEQKIISESEATKRLAETLFDLSEKENKSAGDKAQLLAITEELNKAMPSLNLSIDAQTGAINRQEAEVLKLIEAELQLQRTKLAGANLAQIELDRLEAEKELARLEEDRTKKLEEQTKAIEKNSEAAKNASYNEWGWNFDSLSSEKSLREINSVVEELDEQIDISRTKINELNKQYQLNLDYIGEYGSKVVADSANTVSETAKVSINDYVKYVEKAYKESTNTLEERLKREQKALSKAQKAQTQAVQDASDQELKTLEKAHEKKLELINDEYMEKMKVVDEKRYKELKVIQDEIDKINNQTEAENRAIQLREEAEERIALQTKIATAETTEDRLKAQEELAEFEKKISREKLISERSLQVDILKERQDTVNETYDAEIKSLENQKKAVEDQEKEKYQVAKEKAQERLQVKLEELAEIQEVEREKLTKSQEEYRQYLVEQKELAIENAKKITQDELNEQKLRNALMYNEEEEQRKKIKELYQTYGPNLNPATNFYIPTDRQNQNTSTNIDTSAIEYAVKAGVSAALRNVTFTAKINNKSFFELISESINNMIR